MFLVALCTDCWKVDSGDFGGKESKENGRRRPIGPVCQNIANAKRKTAEKEKDNNQEEHAQSVLQRIV